MTEDITILDIPEKTNYWIVRANGGEYYTEFYLTETISIGDNEIKFDKIKDIKNEEKFKKEVKKLYSNSSKTPLQIGIIANRLFRFIHKIKIGDVVLVPGEKSQNFLLGIVTSDVKERDQEQQKKELLTMRQHEIISDHSNNDKYRQVKWLKTIDRKDISEKLLYILTMHQSIIEIKDHTYLIDSLISPIHTKGDKLVLNIYVNTQDDIDSEEWEKLFELINQIKDNNEKIVAKTNVQSVGLITLVSWTFGGLLILYGLIGEIDISAKGIKFKGLLPTINQRKQEKIDIDKGKVEVEMLKVEVDKGKIEVETSRTEKQLKELELRDKQRDEEIKKIQHEINIDSLKTKQKEVSKNGKVDEIIKDFDMSIEIRKNEI